MYVNMLMRGQKSWPKSVQLIIEDTYEIIDVYHI